ncbi:hypothetical protein M747DRAFT_299556 [Aspergillus niger ATCC 13496]|uniref:Uncharacterized protein n=1 Tax=Aspergillus niger ATCC 13496 TaxID=1353008 RepID=A0A370BI57_ASPNG|nr:hypothetical protein M747DRAFT_299556 [Aspergillus niger ATCC 13496]
MEPYHLSPPSSTIPTTFQPEHTLSILRIPSTSPSHSHTAKSQPPPLSHLSASNNTHAIHFNLLNHTYPTYHLISTNRIQSNYPFQHITERMLSHPRESVDISLIRTRQWKVIGKKLMSLLC